MQRKTYHIHFVGIGGIGMSGIAEVLLNLGYKVSGSDLQETDITNRLQSLGARIYLGHAAGCIEGADVVVVSSAVRKSNPEIVAAREAKIPVIPRAEMLAELMRLKRYGIAIAGSHGKTSTTSMVGWLLAEAGMEPTVIIGGKVNSFGTNAILGRGQCIVAEADESDGSFLKLSPVLEVVTNIDHEHVDHYIDLHAVKHTFLEFLDKIPFYGAAVVCLDDPNVASILPEIKKRTITYGLTSQADISAREVKTVGLRSRFDVYAAGDLLGSIDLALPGKHNVYNALAAIGVGIELEIPFNIISKALSTFSGVQRRLQIKGKMHGITVVDDYGHHPTEIKATLDAAKCAWPNQRLVVLFQPHRYSRTHGLFKEFCTSFYEADFLVTEIYGAGEQEIEGVSGEFLREGIKQHGQRNVLFIRDVEEISKDVLPMLAEGDVVLTLGAGNIWRVGEELLKMLETSES